MPYSLARAAAEAVAQPAVEAGVEEEVVEEGEAAEGTTHQRSHWSRRQR
jgi:hypothetical protein